MLLTVSDSMFKQTNLWYAHSLPTIFTIIVIFPIILQTTTLMTNDVDAFLSELYNVTNETEQRNEKFSSFCREMIRKQLLSTLSPFSFFSLFSTFCLFITQYVHSCVKRKRKKYTMNNNKINVFISLDMQHVK